jgi:hypothetical protein
MFPIAESSKHLKKILVSAFENSTIRSASRPVQFFATWYFPNVNMVFWYLSVQKSPIMMRRNSVKHYFIETYECDQRISSKR